MRNHRSRQAGESLLTVKDLAQGAGVPDHVVRFYARRGLIRPARHAANGYRQFDPFDVKRIRFIKAAQSLGFSLLEVREILRRSHQGNTPCPMVRDVIERRLQENREHLNFVRALQKRMQHASSMWKQMPDQVPRGESLCALIEAVADDGATGGGRPSKSSRLRIGART